MATSDFLFQGTPPSAWTESVVGSDQMPSWWQAAAQGIISRASQIAAEPYKSYTGPRVAGFDSLQQDAINNATNYQSGVNNTIEQGVGLTQQGGQLFNRGDFDQFMSPYTDNVVNRIAELGQRNLSENLLPEVNDTFIRAGQFGSSRNADFTLRALRDTNESILGQQATALENANNQAMSAYQGAQDRQINAGNQLGALGTAMGTESRNQLTQQNAFGAQAQDQAQKNLDIAYQDFLAQKNAPIDNLNIVNSAIRGYQPTPTTTQYSTNPAPGTGSLSPLQTLTGVLQTYGGGTK